MTIPITDDINGHPSLTEETQLDRIEAKLDAVLTFASEMNKVVEGLTPIIAEVENKGIGALFGMLMKGGKK